MPEVKEPRTIAYTQPLAACPFLLPQRPAGIPHDVAMVEVDAGVHAVICRTCGATGPIENYDNARQTPEQAAELWNARGNTLQ